MAMVVLVRCSDDTYSVAMESRLDELVMEGLVTAYLRDGEWVTPRERRPAVLGVERRRQDWRSASLAA